MLFFGSQHFIDHISPFFFFATLGIALNYVAYKKNFYTLPTSFDSRRWFLRDTFFCLMIYLAISFYLSPMLVKKIVSITKLDPSSSQKNIMMLLQLVTILLNLIGLGLYLLAQNRNRVKNIWKDSSMKNETSVAGDVTFGFLTWFLAFPVVVVIHQLCEIVNKFIFKQVETDQAAVKYLKHSTTTPSSFYIALFAIIIAAPFIEEFIFRGCIQNTIRQCTNRKLALILSSVIFSAFHFSPMQKASNFPLLFSLFFFSLYLGFLYEKRRSLFANITLHMTFNAISVIRILFG